MVDQNNEIIKKTNNKVNHPSHYGGENNPYEAIKIIEAYNLDFCIGNSLKYILRAGKKSSETEIEDLEKAEWYLRRKIEFLKNNNINDVKLVDNRIKLITHIVLKYLKKEFPLYDYNENDTIEEVVNSVQYLGGYVSNICDLIQEEFKTWSKNIDQIKNDLCKFIQEKNPRIKEIIIRLKTDLL